MRKQRSESKSHVQQGRAFSSVCCSEGGTPGGWHARAATTTKRASDQCWPKPRPSQSNPHCRRIFGSSPLIHSSMTLIYFPTIPLPQNLFSQDPPSSLIMSDYGRERDNDYGRETGGGGGDSRRSGGGGGGRAWQTIPPPHDQLFNSVFRPSTLELKGIL